MKRFVLFLGLSCIAAAAVCQGLPVAERIGRGECKVEGGVLTTKDVYACYGDTGWKNYEFSFRAMGVDVRAPAAQPVAGEVHICAGFRARNRDDQIGRAHV